MATTAKLDPKFEATVIALRENIMTYFKGRGIPRLTEGNVNLVPLARYMERLPYQYMRVALENENPQILCVGKLPVAVLRKHPEKISLHVAVLALTKSLQRLEQELRQFHRTYLAGIPLTENATLKLGKGIPMTLPALDDDSLFKSAIREDVPDEVLAEGQRPSNLDELVELYTARFSGGLTVEWHE